MITNLINNKKYIGITNNIQKRWANHKCCNEPTMAISQAIKKYGANNFKFEVLLSNVPIDKIDELEKEYIKKYNTHVSYGQGYNISKGGRGFKGIPSVRIGADNANAHLTAEEVQYIKSHRNIPEYVLYDSFSDKIGYSAFKDIYNDKTYQNIKPTVSPYPYNIEFSGQFASNNKLDYDEVVELRKQYAKLVYWKDAYKKYENRYSSPWNFWNIYNGNIYSLVMPEVFTEENKKAHTLLRSAKGENNGRAKLSWNDVHKIRYEYEHKLKTRKQIQQEYPQVTSNSINGILRYDTWKE